jgi:hypothetical protein
VIAKDENDESHAFKVQHRATAAYLRLYFTLQRWSGLAGACVLTPGWNVNCEELVNENGFCEEVESVGAV